MTWVPVNTRLVGQGLAYILEHCDPQLAVADEKHQEAIRACAVDPSRCETIEHGQDGLLAQILILPMLVNVRIAMVPRLSASRFWRDVAEAGATHIHHLGGILQMLLGQPVRPDDKDHGVRIAWGGGCPAETRVQFEERFGIPIRECYGMSEASSVTSVNVSGKVDSVGRPLPWLNVSIENANEEGRGEIVARETETGVLFAGYFRNEEATSRTLIDGALHTGDPGSLDEDGDLWFHGRMSDSIRVKGENMSAWEIESVVTSHPDVKECAATGVDAEVGEQDIKLFVRLSEGSQLRSEELAVWLKPRLAAFQLPEFYEVVQDFPRTPGQRIIKGQLT